MSYRFSHARRGATLIFVLMALIALLAIGVVLLSRLRHKDAIPETSPAATHTPAEVATPGDSPTSAPAMEMTTSTTESAAPVVPPPPPPPPPTVADPKSLPPEG